MKDLRKTEIKVGLMVILGILIFIWILGWAKNFSFTSTEKEVYAKFNNVSGLEVGDYVTVNGVRKGHVEDFNIENEDVIVKMNIAKDTDLREDAVFAVTMLDLMGGKKINIDPGTSSKKLNYDEIHNGVFYADIPTVMTMVGSMQEDLVNSLKEVKITLSSLNKYLTDKKLNSDIKSSVSNLNEVTQKLNIVLDENQANIKKLAENSADLAEKANQFISENKDDIKGSILEIRDVLKKTDSLLTKANAFSDEIKAQNNNIGKILYDRENYENLTQTIKQLKEVSKLLLNQLNNEGLKVDAHIKLF